MLVTAAVAAVAIVKAENRRFLIAFMMAATGLFYLFEYVLVALGDAYAYRPMLFPDNPFTDTYAGNVFSQTSIAASCGLIIVLKPKWYWYTLIAAAYWGVEVLFTRLGIYEPHWYKNFYTPIILVPLFWAMKKLYEKAASTSRKIDGLLLVFFAAMSVTGITVTMPMRMMNLFIYTGGFFADPSRDHTVTGMIFGIILVCVLISAYRKRRWHWKAALIALFIGLNWAAMLGGLIWFRHGWFVWVTLIEIVTFYAWICLAEWLVKGREL